MLIISKDSLLFKLYTSMFFSKDEIEKLDTYNINVYGFIFICASSLFLLSWFAVCDCAAIFVFYIRQILQMIARFVLMLEIPYDMRKYFTCVSYAFCKKDKVYKNEIINYNDKFRKIEVTKRILSINDFEFIPLYIFPFLVFWLLYKFLTVKNLFLFYVIANVVYFIFIFSYFMYSSKLYLYFKKLSIINKFGFVYNIFDYIFNPKVKFKK